jgi:hypothetical protein
MIDLDAFQLKWAEQDRKLDVSLRLNRKLLIAVNMNRVRWPLRRFTFFVGFEALIGLIVLVVLGQFICANWAEPRFALPAVALHVWVIATVVAAIRQMAMALSIDYDKPIAAIQRQIESLRVLRIRVTQWALLTGQVIWWVPFLIVALKGFWGVDAYRAFGEAFLAANFLFGLAIIPLATWTSKKFDGRMSGSPFIQWLMKSLAGSGLNAASGFLATLSDFENEERAA